MKIDVLTLFPEFFLQLGSWSIIKRAVENNKLSLQYTNIRDFSLDKHNKVDDYPYGGGPGMLMQAGPISRAIKSCREKNSKIIYLSPQGKVFNQTLANKLSKEKHLILLCGHYEGIDQRIIDNYVDMEISIGDYVLTGGEIPAMVLVDSVTRLLPGVLGKEDSYIEDSHYNGFLEYPQYTRPYEFEGHKVPDILLSGNHENIKKWRIEKSIENTLIKRPDMLKNRDLPHEIEEVIKKIHTDKK